MLHIQRTSSLLPYTTLFRSPHEWTPMHIMWDSGALDKFVKETSTNMGSSIDPYGTRVMGYYARSVRDRKSTRLNSSHGYISYAVFCLKKKKIIIMLRKYTS